MTRGISVAQKRRAMTEIRRVTAELQQYHDDSLTSSWMEQKKQERTILRHTCGGPKGGLQSAIEAAQYLISAVCKLFTKSSAIDVEAKAPRGNPRKLANSSWRKNTSSRPY